MAYKRGEMAKNTDPESLSDGEWKEKSETVSSCVPVHTQEHYAFCKEIIFKSFSTDSFFKERQLFFSESPVF